jgi:PAS domain S-box-containing protein
MGKYSQDNSGIFYSADEFIRHVRNANSVPIFCLSDTYLKPGVVGGKIIDNVLFGEIIGKCVHFIINQQDFSLDTLYHNQNKWMLSYPEIKARKWSSLTPDHVTYLFKPKHFLERNSRILIPVSILLFLGLIAMLVIIYFNHILRKKLHIKTRLLQKQLDKYEQLAFTMPLGYIEFDSQLHPLRCNHISNETLGYNSEKDTIDAIAKILSDHLSDENFQQTVNQLMCGETTHSIVPNIEKSDGSMLTCDIYAIPIYDNSEVIQLIALTVDITKSLELNATLEKLAENSKKLLMQNNKYLSSSIHDLKNLMSPMVAYIEMLGLIVTDEKAKSILAKMNHCTSNIIESFTQMMTISRLKGDVYNFNKEELNPSNITKNILGMLEATYKQKGIEVFNYIPEITTVVGDKDMVNSIFLNLIGNSIKFTNKGEKITISTTESDDKFVSFSVENNGIKADLSRINLIFTEQKHFSTTGTEGEEGTGMGLLLCHDLIAKNGGSISVSHNDEGGGCRFTFTLPVQ